MCVCHNNHLSYHTIACHVIVDHSISYHIISCCLEYLVTRAIHHFIVLVVLIVLIVPIVPIVPIALVIIVSISVVIYI